jgi:hypothetical protein
MVLAGAGCAIGPGPGFFFSGDARHFLAAKEPVNRESPSAADQQRRSH